jgi:lipopolysaccharide transport system ATP-binding protein
MSSDASASVSVRGLSKCYCVYDKPSDRLKQMLCRGRRRYYREFWALQDVSFDLAPGQTLGIIGRNGSGKSTLLQMLCGTLSPTYGEMRIKGRIAALLELGSGFNPEFTGRENVSMNAALLGLTPEEVAARFQDIIDFADIGEHIDQPIKTYSSGMYVRLAFAIIAHVDADILVIDEALAVGDAFFTQKCMRFLRQFQKTGTLLFVSHDTYSVMGLCTRAIWLEKGTVVADGTPKEVCERYLEAFYEAQQGKSTTTAFRPLEARVPEPETMKDQRLEVINQSVLRNDLHVFEFNLEGSSFGLGGAQIIVVELLNQQRYPLSWIVGGEIVVLGVTIEVNERLDSPTVGFLVKDRLGQAIFGDNTYLSYLDKPVVCETGQQLRAEFVFSMPILPAGTYSVTVAVANGTQQDHVQHHWIHDALFFKSESSMVATGLVGIPMLRIHLETSS